MYIERPTLTRRREYMKKVTVFVLLLACMLSGCNQKETVQDVVPTPTKEVTQALETKVISIVQNSGGGVSSPTPRSEERTEDLVFVYDKFDSSIYSLDVAEDGTLYAISLQAETTFYSQDKMVEIGKPKQWLYAFNANGECLWRVEMLLPTIDLQYHLEGGVDTKMTVVEWEDGFLYVVLPEIHKMPVLYRLDLETWEWQEIYRFEKFSEIRKLVFMEEKLYVQGILAKPSEKEFVQKPEYVEQYQNRYEGQAIGYLDVENTDAGVTLLPIDVPSDMIKLTEDTLGIYQTGDEAWRIWKYTPAKETWEQTDIGLSYYRSTAEESAEKSPVCQNFLGYADGCIYLKNGCDICYETPDGTELTLFTSGMIHDLKSDGTFLYYYIQSMEGEEIRRIRISELFERSIAENE